VIEIRITQAHGAGGKLMEELISKVLLPNITFKSAGEVGLEELDDGASISIGEKEIVVTTDSHTVKPLFFPGGDIGKLAICGTINDLAVMGARAIAITNAMVIPEGFEIEKLEKIIRSMNKVAREEGIAIIAGDTKVMDKESLDGMIISTTGIGVAEKIIKDKGLSIGDKIIVTGTIGDHGVALLSFREGFGFETTLKSDVSPIWKMVKEALKVGGITAMKDPTRGGLAAVLNEWSSKNNLCIVIEEEKIPMREEVISASEMLGIDPYTVANEGKAIMAVEPEKAEEVLKAIRSTKLGKNAEIIGEVVNNEKYKGKVILKTVVGGERILEAPIGDPIPRVC